MVLTKPAAKLSVGGERHKHAYTLSACLRSTLTLVEPRRAQPSSSRYEIGLVATRTTAGAETWTGAREAGGCLLGCWVSENGQLGRLYVLRGFATRQIKEATSTIGWPTSFSPALSDDCRAIDDLAKPVDLPPEALEEHDLSQFGERRRQPLELSERVSRST